jgi:hypothetical protein
MAWATLINMISLQSYPHLNSSDSQSENCKALFLIEKSFFPLSLPLPLLPKYLT